MRPAVVDRPAWPARGSPLGFAREAAVLVVALAVLLLWDASGLDVALTRVFGGAAGFAWRDHWLTAGLLHEGLRMAAWVLLATLWVSVGWPLPLARGLPMRERLWWVSTTVLCALLVPLIKHASVTSCPWSLAEFGGSARYVPHWLLGVRDGGPGGCFPSGHASTAFAFLPGWHALRERSPRAARAWLLATLVAGALAGVTQLVRGAHYASHSLWTAWICWAVTALSFHLGRPGAGRVASAVSGLRRRARVAAWRGRA